jgi:hypothetical protein
MDDDIIEEVSVLDTGNDDYSKGYSTQNNDHEKQSQGQRPFPYYPRISRESRNHDVPSHNNPSF